MQTVAVIGAGQMGSGIAQTAAQFGNRVLLADVTLELAEKAKAKIGKGLERLTDDPAYDDQAAFSPDEKQLVFVSTRGAASPISGS